MDTIWIQLIITGGAVLTTLFFTLRYFSLQNTKREKSAQDYHKSMQQMQLEYYENKNGHMERMAKDFTKASNKMSSAISKLTTQISVLSLK